MTDFSPKLRGKDRRHLRGLGNALRPTVYLGKEGLSAAVIRSLNEAYANSELVKVRLRAQQPTRPPRSRRAACRRYRGISSAGLGQYPTPLPPRSRRSPNSAARIEATLP